VSPVRAFARWTNARLFCIVGALPPS
jgi:hypothetical protein